METQSERSLRLSGTWRTLIITYGIIGFGWITSAGGNAPVLRSRTAWLFSIGVVIQLAVLAVRWLTRRKSLPTTAVYIAELVADGITVALFAYATLQAISPTNIDGI